MRLFLVLVMVCAPACGDDATDAPDAGLDAGTDCTGRPVEPPSTRGELSGVLDEARGRIVVYGGNTAAPVSCMPMFQLVDEVWAFHFDCASWERLQPAAGPGVRARHASALDTSRDRMLVFGGRNRTPGGSYVNFDDVWAFDLATDTWSAVTATGDVPPARSSATAVYDQARDRLLVFGGNSSTSGLVFTGLGDLHALDLATGVWTRIDAANAPSPRLYHAAASVGGEMVVYGGTPSFDGPFLDDTLAFDLATDSWRSVAASGPGARFGAELFADEAGGRVLLVGGHDGGAMGNRNDVWALDVTTGAWQSVRPGDTLNGAAGGLCDFPSDFTIPEENSPERRYAFVRAQGAGVGYVFGGKTDCGNVNDVWALDLAQPTWNLLRASTGGEACNRTGQANCMTLCY